MDPQTIELITREVYNQIIYIIGWTIGVVTPVITGLIIAIRILWKSKDDAAKTHEATIKEIAAKQEEALKNYYEVTKSLATYLQQSVSIEAKTMEICDRLLRTVETLAEKEERTYKYVADIYDDLKDITVDIESRLSTSHENGLIIKTHLENFIKHAEGILDDVKDEECN